MNTFRAPSSRFAFSSFQHRGCTAEGWFKGWPGRAAWCIGSSFPSFSFLFRSFQFGPVRFGSDGIHSNSISLVLVDIDGWKDGWEHAHMDKLHGLMCWHPDGQMDRRMDPAALFFSVSYPMNPLA